MVSFFLVGISERRSDHDAISQADRLPGNKLATPKLPAG